MWGASTALASSCPSLTWKWGTPHAKGATCCPTAMHISRVIPRCRSLTGGHGVLRGSRMAWSRMVPAAPARRWWAAVAHMDGPGTQGGAYGEQVVEACDVARPPLAFQECDAEEPLFPELRAPGTTAILIGIDPDLSGAVAVLRWRNEGSGNSGSCGSGADRIPVPTAADGALPPLGLAGLSVEVHDIPTEIWALTQRAKRQHDGAALLSMLRAVSPTAAAAGAAPTVRAAVEVTAPAHMSGKHAWFGMGYSTGLLDGLLRATDIPYARVHATTWKRGLGLFKQGKDGSVALATTLFPQAQPLLRRKKDHGRAEALLIAAWALGRRFKGPADGTADSGALVGRQVKSQANRGQRKTKTQDP